MVAMSGGVDSSVAALLLKEQGYDVIGVHIQTWKYEQVCDTRFKACCSPEDVADARSVAMGLDIPFYNINMEDLFEKKVISPFITDYQNARTPNPCVNCNTFFKFGALYDKAARLGIKKIATGHYAKISRIEDRYSITFPRDLGKNQSYYLYGLSQDNLANTIFPLGDLDKPKVREIAREHGMKVGDKQESQEICFIPENDYRLFLKRKNIEMTPGNFVLTDGTVIGSHAGREKFTIGQRKGLGIAWKNPLYVVRLEKEGDVILGEETETWSGPFEVEEVNMMGLDQLPENQELEARVQVRYRHIPIRCLVVRKNNTFYVTPLEKVKSITTGQSAVFYEKNENYILFGGIITA